MNQTTLHIQSQDRSLINITGKINEFVREQSIESGLCHLFIQHTSASLIICENSDPAVQTDLENFMSRLVKDGDPLFTHRDEGEDDMSAHIRTILTETSLMIPVKENSLDLGTWQGVYLWEHRYNKHHRNIVVSVF